MPRVFAGIYLITSLLVTEKFKKKQIEINHNSAGHNFLFLNGTPTWFWTVE